MRLTATIRYAWWVCPYVYALKAFALMTSMEPDVDKAVGVCTRGIRVTVP